MSGTTCVNWSDVEQAAQEMAGNWRGFDSFAWHRAYDIEDSDQWAIAYTSNRDSGLLAQSNEKATNALLERFTDGDDPDLVYETHSHWACGFLTGISLRVFKHDGSITDAFTEFCRIQEQLADYPLLDESDYSEREYEA